MGLFERWRKGERGREERPGDEGDEGDEGEESASSLPEVPGDVSADDPGLAPEPTSREEAMRRGISGWVEERAHRVVRRAYESHAGDIEERARRVIGSMYERTADDLEERAVRAMRKALQAEAGRIKQAIEHAIEVKKREVRLSLVVLVVSSLVYLILYWFTHEPGAS